MITSTCNYIFVKGNKKGTKCTMAKKAGEFCTRHKPKQIKNQDCPICLEQIKDKNCCTLKCGHQFHLPCVFALYNQSSAFSNKCPMCRDEFTEKLQNTVHYVFVHPEDEVHPDENNQNRNSSRIPIPQRQRLQRPQRPQIPQRQRALRLVIESPVPPVPAPIQREIDENHPYQFLAELFNINSRFLFNE